MLQIEHLREELERAEVRLGKDAPFVRALRDQVTAQESQLRKRAEGSWAPNPCVFRICRKGK